MYMYMHDVSTFCWDVHVHVTVVLRVHEYTRETCSNDHSYDVLIFCYYKCSVYQCHIVSIYFVIDSKQSSTFSQWAMACGGFQCDLKH